MELIKAAIIGLNEYLPLKQGLRQIIAIGYSIATITQ